MKRKHLLYLLVFCLLLGGGYTSIAQVTTSPAFPRSDSEVKIIYDAREGVSGLEGADQVYIHIGAVTEGPESSAWDIVPFEWGVDIAEAKMTQNADNPDIWEYTLTPDEFFEKEADETIYRLGLVFRNLDGSLEGKSATGGDFFISLSQGFGVVFSQSSTSNLLLEPGDIQEIEVISSMIADISLSLNGDEVASQSGSDKLTYVFTASAPGGYKFVARATADGEVDESELEIVVMEPTVKEDLPQGTRKGINYLSDTEVVLVLEAPGKKNAFVIGDFNDWEVSPAYQMNQTPDGELFWYHLSGLVPQQEYIFQYLVDGVIKIGDPYADKVSDPWGDQEIIEEDRYPGLSPYPSEKTNFQATFLQTGQEEYEWQYTDYQKPQPEELMIYELLIRDFDERRTYQAVTERLDYLQELGVNAIELMPVQEFEGNLSWGYNPSFFFAPDKYYGTKNDLKTLIDEAHKRDMVVILDMVLNHAFGQSPLVRLYNDGDYGAPTAENPWFNTVAKHPFNVGYDFDHESSYTQELVDSVAHYWLSEYKVDGYRFDLSKGFTQTNSGGDVGKWSQKDESRVAIWKRIYDRIQSHHSGAYVILEHFADNEEEKELANYGMLLWGNMNHTFREMAKGQSQDFSWAYHGERGWEKNHLVTYMESHDEERLMWETLNFGSRSGVDLRNLSHAVNRNQLLAAFFWVLPGPKMIWQFGEMGYDLELNDDRLGIKPTRWEYLENDERIRLFHLYQAMIDLKGKMEGINQVDELVLNLDGEVKTVVVVAEEGSLVLVGNFSLIQKKGIEVDFPADGTWHDYLTGVPTEVSGGNVEMDLGPSQFRLLTDQPLPLPEGQILQEDPITSIGREKIDQADFLLYPVPTYGDLKVKYPSAMQNARYRVVDMSGKVWMEGVNDKGDDILAVQLKDIRAGIYIFELYDNRQVLRKHFIKK